MPSIPLRAMFRTFPPPHRRRSVERHRGGITTAASLALAFAFGLWVARVPGGPRPKTPAEAPAPRRGNLASHPYLEPLRFAVAGRAGVDRLPLACGRSARHTVAALSQLAASGHPAPETGEPMLRVIEIPPERRGALRLRFATSDPAIRLSVTEAEAFLVRAVAARWLPRSEIAVHALPRGERRAFASGLGGAAAIHLRPGVLDVDTAIHELAHHIEGDHRLVLEASKLFLARRAKGGSPESLRDLTGHDYSPDEIALRANWTTRGGHHYSGKFYGPSLKEATATEVLSMGLERLRRDPAAFYRQDADYFLFLLLVLQCPAR